MTDGGTVLVYAARGVRGAPVVSRLLERRFRPRIVTSRMAEAVTDDRAVDIVEGDLRRPATLVEANTGADAVVLQLPVWVADPDVVLGPLDAARAAGVTRIVLVAHTVVPESPCGVARADLMREMEQTVVGAGLDVTVLRAPLYLENLASAPIATALLAHGELAYPLPAEVRCPWMSARDAAAFVVAALEDPGTIGEILRIGGPEQLDGAGLADRLSAGVGRSVRYVPLAIESFVEGLARSIPESSAQLVGDLYRYLSRPEGASLLVGDEHLARRLGVSQESADRWSRRQPWAELARRNHDVAETQQLHENGRTAPGMPSA